MKKMVCVMLFMILLLTACTKRTLTWQEQYDLGIRYLSEGNYQEAIIAFTAAIEIDPKQAEAYIALASLYENQGDIESAKQILMDALGVVDDSEAIQQQLDRIEEMYTEDEPVVDPEEIYSGILDMFYSGISSEWSEWDAWDTQADPYDPNSVSYLISWLHSYSLSEVGYSFVDLNADGLPELLIGIAGNRYWEAGSGMIYDLYTYNDGEVIHLASSGERFTYHLAVDNTINYEGSDSAFRSVTANYRLDDAGEKLKGNKIVIWDQMEDEENPWFYLAADFDYESISNYSFDYDHFTKISESEAQTHLESIPENQPIALQLFDTYQPKNP